MAAVKICDNIWSVGATDWDMRVFHGYKTPLGSTYNAYLVLDEKVTLIDAVKAPFTHELMDNIAQVIDPRKIDIVISNHTEPDHSGALPAIMELLPGRPLYCSPQGEKGLRAYYGGDGWNFKPVKTGDSLCTGKYNFKFVQTPLLHWPDSMATYLAEEEILFSNDAFGQHIASTERFDDEMGLSRLLERAKDYYGNIVMPFHAQAKKALGDVAPLKLKLIAPSHGLIWRSHIADILGKYADWADAKTDERLAVIVYDSMWGATHEMALKIAEGFAKEGVRSKLVNLKIAHVSEAMNDLVEARYICVGSPTLNKGVMHSVAAFLSYMKGLNPRNRVGMAFGSYGWSGESVGVIRDALSGMGWELRDDWKIQYRAGL